MVENGDFPKIVEGAYVEYIGEEHAETPMGGIYLGHPGLVIENGLWPTELTIQFVNGPTECVNPQSVRPLILLEYLSRGDRLVALRHPLQEREVPRFLRAGQEWGGMGRPS